ncbi:LOW QUALITY PROTEIN: zinc finger and SCAN domain-containing protein 4 [Callospermophilus lateralis]
MSKFHEIFHSWLQPEKHSKDIISQLVLEQFMINGNCRDKFTLKGKWEGQNLEKLMEELTYDCVKPLVIVHVPMQGEKDYPTPKEKDVCCEILTQLQRSKAHQRRHRNERSFVHTKCQNSFFQTSDLHVHQMSHAKEKPFMCRVKRLFM